MWLYDAFDPWYYDVLDTTPGVVYVQQANGIIQLSGGAEQVWPGAYEQPLDGTLFVYGGAFQTWSPPSQAQAYLQQANGLLTLIGGALQEHSPALGGQDGQTGNGVIHLFGGAIQEYRPGANPGDVLQDADGVITLFGGALQAFLPPELSQTVSQLLDAVEPYGSQAVQPVHFAVGTPPPFISRVNITVQSIDPLFTSGVGPNAGQVFVEISLRKPERVPLVSVSAAKPTAEFFIGQQSAFDQLLEALSDGALDLEFRAYEALPGRVAPLRLAESTVTVEVLP